MADAAIQAFFILMDPSRLIFLFGGVAVGLFLGVVPGLGGIVGLALLLPFTFGMDPYAAFAMLIGMQSVTTTSDTIPAVLFGVPGTSGSAATVLDGHPLARRGEAGRAFGAAYSASLLGGIFGALLLGVSIPILRPLMLQLTSPDLLAISVFGLSMVAVLSGNAPLRGLIAAAFGVLIAAIGTDQITGDYRWTWDSDYLAEGLPLVPISLGIFALPELIDMAINRRSIASGAKTDTRSGQWQGVRDTLQNWFLLIRVAFLGSALGAVPGIGAPIVDWMAYGHGARSVKGGSETFGTGDIRGVISSEGANNAKEGGSLVPTIAFGVPGSAGMALLLGAFLIHGLAPGPDMLTKHLDMTYTMVWSVALANILGAGLCFLFSDQLAKIATIRHSILVPIVVVIVFVGAFQASRFWEDLYALLFFGTVGWIMKQQKWPRPPLILGVVLGDIIERYLFISIDVYGTDWLYRIPVIIFFAMSAWGLLIPLYKEFRRANSGGGLLAFHAPRIDFGTVFFLFVLAGISWLLYETRAWDPDAALVPRMVAWFAIGTSALSLFSYIFRSRIQLADQGQQMDTVADAELPQKEFLLRAFTIFAWIFGLLGLIGLIGMLPAAFIFLVAYMRVSAREPWWLAILIAAVFVVFAWAVFDQALSLPWPPNYLGDAFPELAPYIPSLER